MLQALKSQEDGFSPHPQREPFDSVEDAVSSEVEVDKAAWVRSETADDAMRTLTLKSFIHLHALLGSSTDCTLYALDNGKLFEGSTAQKFCLTAPPLLPWVCDS